MFKSLILVPLAAALSVSANAQDVSVSVGYHDLDLTSAAGVARLDNRLDAAVEQACGDRFGQKPLSAVLAIRKCSREAWTDVESPRQIAIERARGKQPSVEIANADSAIKFAVARRRR